MTISASNTTVEFKTILTGIFGAELSRDFTPRPNAMTTKKVAYKSITFPKHTDSPYCRRWLIFRMYDFNSADQRNLFRMNRFGVIVLRIVRFGNSRPGGRRFTAAFASLTERYASGWTADRRK